MSRKLLLALILAPILARGQSTTVSATITDTDSQVWANGSYSIAFLPSPSWPSISTYKWSGGNLQQNALFNGSLDASGHFSISIPDNTTITPSGSQWAFTICPNATTGCQTLNLQAQGASQNFTTQLSAAALGPRFPCTTSCYGYTTTEVQSARPGAQFYNTNLGINTPFYRTISGTWASFPIGGPFCLISGCSFTGAVTTTVLNSVTTIQAGSTLTSAIIATACPGTPAMIQLPPGTVNSTTSLTVPSNCYIVGSGQAASILSCSNASPIASCLDMNGISSSALEGFTIQCASSPATCTTALRIRFSSNILLTNLLISGGGYGSGTNPLAQVYTENTDNVLADNVRMINSGGRYEWVNGYNGLVSTRLHLRSVIDENNTAIISLSLFNCQFCAVDGGTTVNENNQTDSSTADGYGILFYATNTLPAVSCTGSGTLTCTVALSGGNTQIPVGASFRAQILGVTGGTGTLNGIFDATLASTTTFTITGGNTSGASYASATAFFPTTNNLISDVHVKNTAGSCIYLQSSEYTTINSYDLENCDQQQSGATLPAGGIAINGSTPSGNLVHGDVVGSGTINGSGQTGMAFSGTLDLSVSGSISILNHTTYGIHLYGGSLNNTNFAIGGKIAIDGGQNCVVTTQTNTGSVSGVSCQNFSVNGLHPAASNIIDWSNINMITTSYLPGVDDFVANQTYSNVWCTGCFWFLAGTNTKVSGGGARSVITGGVNHGLQLSGAQHIKITDFTIDTANDGIFLNNSGSTQTSDVLIQSAHLININNQPAIWDQAPTALTITTHTSTSVDIAATGSTITSGMGIADYGSGGNNDIPPGAAITTNPGSCAAGCTVTISAAATGSHTSEAGLLQASMSNNIRLWDMDIQGNTASCPTSSQVILMYGFQSSDIERPSISCFGGQGVIDIRGNSNGVTINGGTVTGGVGALAGVYMGGGLQGNAQNVSISNMIYSGSLTNSIYDHSVGTGNQINLYTSTLDGNAISVTNTNTTITGVIASGTAAMTTALIGSGACGSTVTVSATGVKSTDSITWAFNAVPAANPGELTVNPAPTANNVNFAYCNPTAGSVTPSAATINWKVSR